MPECGQRWFDSPNLLIHLELNFIKIYIRVRLTMSFILRVTFFYFFSAHVEIPDRQQTEYW